MITFWAPEKKGGEKIEFFCGWNREKMLIQEKRTAVILILSPECPKERNDYNPYERMEVVYY